jgi:GNAT superfamily N-acetyltransferase
MSTVISVQKYADVIEDIKPLLGAHHEELALYKDEIPLDPDYGLYQKLNEMGLIRAYTVRLGGALIGYAIFSIVARHLHYAHRWAINDILWIHKDHRHFGIGSELCDVFEEDLRREGPIVIHIETKDHEPALAMLLRARGYDVVGVSLSKRFA